MRGPYWNHGKTGVTGERLLATKPKYIVAEVDGQRRTFTSADEVPAGATIVDQVGN